MYRDEVRTHCNANAISEPGRVFESPLTPLRSATLSPVGGCNPAHGRGPHAVIFVGEPKLHLPVSWNNRNLELRQSER